MARSPWLLWLALLAYVGGCVLIVKAQPPEPRAIIDRSGDPCWIRIQGQKLYLGAERCYKRFSARRMCGIWIAGFEHSWFLRDLKTLDDVKNFSPYFYPWLDLGAASSSNVQWHPRAEGGAYHICFVGRESPYFGVYGHMGMSPTGILVERFGSVREVPIPRTFKIAPP